MLIKSQCVDISFLIKAKIRKGLSRTAVMSDDASQIFLEQIRLQACSGEETLLLPAVQPFRTVTPSYI